MQLTPNTINSCSIVSSRGRRLPAIALLALIAGCSNKQLYGALQDSQKVECQKYPDTRYEECMERLSTPYEEYENDRTAEDSPHE